MRHGSWTPSLLGAACLLLSASIALAGGLTLRHSGGAPGHDLVLTTTGGAGEAPYLLLQSWQPGDSVRVGGRTLGVGVDYRVLAAGRLGPDGGETLTWAMPPGMPEATCYLQEVSLTGAGGGPVSQQDLAASNLLQVTLGGQGPATWGPPEGADGEDAPPRSPLGINLAFATYWSPQLAFVDVFRQSNSFQPTSGTLNLRPDGYPASLDPGQFARASMCKDIDGRYPAGRYVCLHDGTGDLSFAGDATKLAEEPGRYLLDVSPTDSGIVLMITQTDPNDPVRNIRVLMPGFEDRQDSVTFFPAFLDNLRPFGCLRFMDWMLTNDSPQQSWSDRPTPSFQTQGALGVSVEFMVELANTLQVDPWFCMPHLADDNYVTQFATYVRDSLDPSLTPHVEYSNEAWNSTFSQTSYCQQMGLSLGLDTRPAPAGLKYYSQRSVEVFRLWEAVFGQDRPLVRVLAAQSANPATGVTIMDWQGAYQDADCLAIAPYFGGRLGQSPQADHLRTGTVEEVLELCEHDLARAAADIEVNGSNARQRRLELVAYEGGQHLVGRGAWKNDRDLAARFQEANRRPEMGQMYRQYLESWMRQDGHLFVLYNDVTEYGRYGSWGLKEWQEQDPAAAPKYQGVLGFLADFERWW